MTYFPEDILIIIFRYLHRDKMKLLNIEYHFNFISASGQYIYCIKHSPACVFNYRHYWKPVPTFMIKDNDQWNNITNLNRKVMAVLPKNYYKILIVPFRLYKI